MTKRVAWLGLLGLVLAFSAARADVSQETESLKAYEKKIEEQRGRLKGLLKKEKSLFSELNRFSRKIGRLTQEKTNLESKKNQTENRLDQTSTRIRKLEKEVAGKRDNVADRLRDLYMWKQPNYLRIMLSAHTFADFRQRRWFVQRWIEEDRAIITEYEGIVRELSAEKKKLEKDRASLHQLIQRSEKNRKELRQEKGSRSNLLAVVQNQKDFYRKSIRDLQEAAKNLQKLIEELRRSQAEGASLFAQMRGRLPMPVKGRLEKKFGPYTDPKVQAKLYHKGIDLRASMGTPVNAVFDGKVVFSDWFVGYGKILILDHGGGYFTLYAHVDNVQKEKGSDVTVGETIAYVGDTGSIKGPYLYFELRHKGISRNPWPWFSRSSR